MVDAVDIETWIKDNWQADDLSIEVKGDGYHFEALLVSDMFEGQNRLARHRLVYAALGDKMQEVIHALSIKAMTNQEYKDK